MPIHVIWGDDISALEKETEEIINKAIDPNWSTINLNRIDGEDSEQIQNGFSEARTPALGAGGRVIIIKKSPLLNGCSSELSNAFERILELIPRENHLILINTNQPDGRLKITKTFKKLVQDKKAFEKNFKLPSIWDHAGQKNLIERIAKENKLKIEPEAILLLIEAIGNDSEKINSELQKLALYAQANDGNGYPLKISTQSVRDLIDGINTNALEIGNKLLSGNRIEAIELTNELIASGEPALKIISTLSGLARGWLWINLMETKGEKDVGIISKAAGIKNPKRIYVMQKQIKGKSMHFFLDLLSCCLEIEAALKSGVQPKEAFFEGLINQKSLTY